MLLEVNDLRAGYGLSQVLFDVSFEIGQGVPVLDIELQGEGLTLV